MNRKSRTTRAVRLLVAVLITAFPTTICFHVVRQAQLDSALIAAIERRDANAALTLLKEGADANAFKKTEPLSWIALLNELFRRRCVPSSENPPAVCMASFHNEPQVVCALVRRGADPNSDTEGNDPPLIWMEFYNHPRAVQVLLNAGANVRYRNSSGGTPFEWAVKRGSIPEAVDLLARGADINARGWCCDDVGDQDRFSPLGDAVDSGSAPMVEFLMAHGADVNGTTENGDTPLRLALTHHHPGIAEILKRAGAHE